MSIHIVPRPALLLAAAIAALVASPACAASEPKARLVACDGGSRLLVTGQRADAASMVSINGHAVVVTGANKWRVSVPVDTVRDWSAPFARTISVAVMANHAPDATPAEVDLPIGMLGHSSELAMLVVSVK